MRMTVIYDCYYYPSNAWRKFLGNSPDIALEQFRKGI